jgi:hypothetical protein
VPVSVAHYHAIHGVNPCSIFVLDNHHLAMCNMSLLVLERDLCFYFCIAPISCHLGSICIRNHTLSSPIWEIIVLSNNQNHTSRSRV